MTFKEWIFDIFRVHHKGKDKAITRNELLMVLNATATIAKFHIMKFTDREMRLAYEDLPICGSSKGLYLPETKAEIDEQIKLHWSKIYSYFRKIDILEHYQIESDAIQKNLF